MAIPGKGTRRIIVEGVEYRWRNAYDRLHWAKGYVSEVRITIQRTDPPGQLLVTRFLGCGRDRDDPLSQPFPPSFIHKLIQAGLEKGWQPSDRGGPPFRLDESEVRRAVSG